MTLKKCNKCLCEKDVTNFYKSTRGKFGVVAVCKDCKSVLRKEDYIENPQKYKNRDSNRSRKEYDRNRVGLYRERRRDIDKKRYEENKLKLIRQNTEYRKKRKVEDVLFKLRCNLRSKISSTLNLKNNKSEEILGCTYKEFKIFLESKFSTWMTWDNYGLYNGNVDYGWDIDHIIPLSSAKDEKELLELCHYSNLQPLCSYINRVIKKGKINERE